MWVRKMQDGHRRFRDLWSGFPEIARTREREREGEKERSFIGQLKFQVKSALSNCRALERVATGKNGQEVEAKTGICHSFTLNQVSTWTFTLDANDVVCLLNENVLPRSKSYFLFPFPQLTDSFLSLAISPAFLKHLECAKPEHLKILNEVLGRLTLSLEFVASNVTRDEMIFHACCTLQGECGNLSIVLALKGVTRTFKSDN